MAIEVGEQLTERQMLEAMLTQSANDIAYSLAVWDAGSVDAFVVKMNALAASLGTTDTHYVDASGYDPATVSSASDVLRVAAVGMAIPTFAEIVALTQVTLPLAGTLHNIVAEIGVDGVIGVKSGYTSQAGACMVLAADRVIDGRTLLVLVAVTRPAHAAAHRTAPRPPPPVRPGTTTTTDPVRRRTTTTTTTLPLDDQPIADPFKYARPTTTALLAATQAGISQVTVATRGSVAGTVTSTWGGAVHRATVRVGHRRLAAGLAGPGGAVDDHVHRRRAGERGRHPGGHDDLRHRRAVPGGAAACCTRRCRSPRCGGACATAERGTSPTTSTTTTGPSSSTATSTSGPTASTTAAPTPG